MQQPLKGAKVIELSGFMAVPAAGRILAEWGAEVIKVEPPDGDPTRTTRGTLPNTWDQDPAFQIGNANKKSIVLDLKKPGAMAIMDRLLGGAAVFLTNNRIQALKKLGLDYETMSKKHPHIIWAWLGGFGEKGPRADDPGFDTVSYWAMSGAMIDITERDTAPIVPPTAFGDCNAGCTLAGAVAAALYGQKVTGKGTKLIMSLYGQAVWNMSTFLAINQLTQVQYPLSRKNTNPANNSYRCKDGKWMIVTALPLDKYLPAIAKLMKRPDLLENPKYSTGTAAYQNRVEVIEIFDEAFLLYTQDEWDQLFLEEGVPHSKILNSKDVLSDPQAIENVNIQKYTQRNGTEIFEAVPPVRFQTTEPAKREMAPLCGEHTVEVLTRFGFGEGEIKSALDAEIISQRE